MQTLILPLDFQPEYVTCKLFPDRAVITTLSQQYQCCLRIALIFATFCRYQKQANVFLALLFLYAVWNFLVASFLGVFKVEGSW